MQATLNIAIEAAREAGKVIFRNMSRVHSLSIQTKEKNDFVSEVDLQAEQEIINVIHRVYPQHGILAGRDDDPCSRGMGQHRTIDRRLVVNAISNEAADFLVDL